jgi:hypothetical protein
METLGTVVVIHHRLGLTGTVEEPCDGGTGVNGYWQSPDVVEADGGFGAGTAAGGGDHLSLKQVTDQGVVDEAVVVPPLLALE